MTDDTDDETRRHAELWRLAQARRLMAEVAADLALDDPLRLAIARALAAEPGPTTETADG